MANDSSGGEKLEGGEGCVVGLASDPLAVLLDMAVEGDSQFSAGIGPLAREMLVQLDPRDSAEKMLVVQMIATFGRSMFLSRHANKQKNPKWFALYSGECDRTMNLYRKQMQALADYRRPRRRTFTAIRTANIAGQQVVVSGSVGGGTGGAGADRREARGGGVEFKTEKEAALPAVGGGESSTGGGDR